METVGLFVCLFRKPATKNCSRWLLLCKRHDIVSCEVMFIWPLGEKTFLANVSPHKLRSPGCVSFAGNTSNTRHCHVCVCWWWRVRVRWAEGRLVVLWFHNDESIKQCLVYRCFQFVCLATCLSSCQLSWPSACLLFCIFARSWFSSFFSLKC